MRLPDHPNAATGRDYLKVTFDGRQNGASYCQDQETTLQNSYVIDR
jgi:hypothetical protein